MSTPRVMFGGQRAPDPAPPAVPGCENVRRVWDSEYQRWAARILPGEIFVTLHDELIATVVGSCIAVCVRDPVLRLGGMSLFMLPSRSRHAGGGSRSDAGGPAPLQGCFELERLIGEVVKLGADHSRLKAKMFGGSRNLSGVTDAGARTTAFVRQFLRQQGLPLVEEKIGDRHPRRIVYFPYSGTALVKRLSSRHSATVANQETQYVDSLVLEPMTINLAPESPASARRS